ncbi:MAG: hypothetical protein K2Y56_06775 [Methylobacterium sp.]|uniref:hypothetical protein n=1 Tax=Methylobacterium sp. TaxID=409 RepID=UPI0025E14C1D|nr:hypothetical protein [Methylobacterium sp.]MBX9931226.1 hypothetical protein [Methylobacterium sp.]
MVMMPAVVMVAPVEMPGPIVVMVSIAMVARPEMMPAMVVMVSSVVVVVLRLLDEVAPDLGHDARSRPDGSGLRRVDRRSGLQKRSQHERCNEDKKSTCHPTLPND